MRDKLIQASAREPPHGPDSTSRPRWRDRAGAAPNGRPGPTGQEQVFCIDVRSVGLFLALLTAGVCIVLVFIWSGESIPILIMSIVTLFVVLYLLEYRPWAADGPPGRRSADRRGGAAGTRSGDGRTSTPDRHGAGFTSSRPTTTGRHRAIDRSDRQPTRARPEPTEDVESDESTGGGMRAGPGRTTARRDPLPTRPGHRIRETTSATVSAPTSEADPTSPGESSAVAPGDEPMTSTTGRSTAGPSGQHGAGEDAPPRKPGVARGQVDVVWDAEGLSGAVAGRGEVRRWTWSAVDTMAIAVIPGSGDHGDRERVGLRIDLRTVDSDAGEEPTAWVIYGPSQSPREIVGRLKQVLRDHRTDRRSG